MSKVDQLLTFYRQVLNGLDCNVTEDSLVQFVNKSSNYPVTVGDKELRLALPTNEILSQLSKGGIAAMHPMCESIILGQSPVIATLRNVTIESLTLKIVSTMLGITMAIADKVEMTATQIKFASDFDKVDEKTVKALTKLVMAIDPSSENRLINLYLKHGGLIGDDQYKRVATVTFPIYGELLEATDTVFGVKMRKQDVKLIRTMLEKIFPYIGEKDGYSAGSNSLSCPYFHALLNGFANVVESLNKVTYNFRKIIREYTGVEPHVTLDYIHDFEEGNMYRDILPPFDYNQGTEAGGGTPQAKPMDVAETQQPLRRDYEERVNHAPAPEPQHAPQHQPAYQLPPAYQAPAPQYPTFGGPSSAQQPAPRRGYVSNKIKSIGATTEESGQSGAQQPASQVQERPLAEMMYPPSMYPQMQPPQPQRAMYPKFGQSGRMVQPAQPPVQPYPPQGYPQHMAPPPQGYPPQPYMAPQPYPQGQPYPPQMMPQGYPPQGYPQPVANQGYPTFGGNHGQPYVQQPGQMHPGYAR